MVHLRLNYCMIRLMLCKHAQESLGGVVFCDALEVQSILLYL